MRALVGALVLLAALVGMPAQAEERKTVMIYNGFMTGQECHEASDGDMSSYMMGVVNGLLISPLYGAPAHRMKPLSECLKGVTNTQLAAILKKWLKNNPERWNDGCHVAASMALRELCGFFR